MILKGSIVVKQFRNHLISKNIDVIRTFKQFNCDGNSSLDYQEFRTLILNFDETLSNKEIDYAFKYFDVDQGGNIS
jgi:Ca2+-binding EF-hand superfamily protein